MTEIATQTFPEREVTHLAPAETGTSAIVSVIERAARDPAVDVEKMERLLAMQERMMDRQAEADFTAALVRATGDMPRVKKNGTIDLGVDKNTGRARGSLPFAKWEDVDAVLRPIMQREGFTLLFDSSPRASDGGGAVVHATLLHAGGHKKMVSMSLPLDTGPGRNNLQAMGSTLAYGKRYLAEMLFNIVREGVDDDGKAGGTVYIDADTAKAIHETIARFRLDQQDVESFLDFMAVHSVEEIELKDLTKARNALRTHAPKKEPAQ